MLHKILITIFLILLILISAGCSEQYDEETIMKAEDVTKSYIESNYAEVESIELEETYQSPMGSLTVDGTVNGAGFSASLNKDFSIAAISSEEGFPESKEGCKERTCDY
jgi:hypothetical protein